jgi:hypothetical protein
MQLNLAQISNIPPDQLGEDIQELAWMALLERKQFFFNYNNINKIRK